jgi:hypothetical protein
LVVGVRAIVLAAVGELRRVRDPKCLAVPSVISRTAAPRVPR